MGVSPKAICASQNREFRDVVPPHNGCYPFTGTCKASLVQLGSCWAKHNVNMLDAGGRAEMRAATRDGAQIETRSQRWSHIHDQGIQEAHTVT